MTFPRWVTLFGVMVGLCVVRGARATVIDTANFTETTWLVSGGTRTGMAWAPDGSRRLFLLSKEGTVHIVKWGSPPTITTFVTIAPVYTTSECGLIGMTFDPNFQVNQYIYFFVTVSATEQQIIRYTAVGDMGTDKTVIVSGLPTNGQNHDGGSIGFGPDGKLYWGIGDNGNFTGVNADLSLLASKIGRANPDGTVPNDNPFFDGPGPNNDYIWARGVRNPFTLTFQPTTGELWLNVVGTLYEQVFIIGKGDHAGWNAYENNQPAGFLTPVITYRTNGTDTLDLTAGGAVRSLGVVTFTTTAVHGFRLGENITVAGVGDASFDGAFYVASVPSTTSFTVLQAGPDATSGNGTATTLNQGGCITGGSFYDGTQFGPAYRGNYFYGDYNSSRVMRAVLGAGNAVVSVDYWATDVPSATDTSIGPDGAMYYVGIGGTIFRTTFNAAAQAIVLSSTHVWMAENGQTSVNVSLATAPAADVTVTSARVSGDTDVGVGAGAVLTFTPSNWNVPQVLTLTAADDLDVSRDTATIDASSAGIPTESIVVNVIDDDANNFIVSRAALAIVEGASGTFTVALAAAPSAPVTVSVARTAGDTDIGVASGASLIFDGANFAVPQTVTIAAAEDSDVTDDTADISITATGITARTVAVTATDNDPAAPLITSTAPAKGVVDAPYRYNVIATGLPAPTFSLTSPPAGMTIDAITGVIDWTPHVAGMFSATVNAENGVAPSATQAFTIQVLADAAPTCSLTKPVQGDVVFGKTSEFFGDGFDDVGTTKAEFFVDGTLAYTDVNNVGHYHFGGEHNRWDTTVLSDGAHKAKMVVTDTAGQTCAKEVDVIVANLADGGPEADAMVPVDADPSDGLVDSGSVTDAPEVRDATDASRDVSRDADGDAGATVADVVDTDGANADGPDAATDGAARDIGASDANAGSASSDDGCGCRVGRSDRPVSPSLLGFGSLILLAGARRKRRLIGSTRLNLIVAGASTNGAMAGCAAPLCGNPAHLCDRLTRRADC